MRAASVYYQGMFDKEKFTLPKQIIYKKDVTSDTPFYKELSSFMGSGDMLTSEIFFQGQTYVKGDLIVLKMVDCDEVKVGLVQTILIRGNKVYFVCKVYQCIRSWLLYFESQRCETHCSFVEAGKIADYKPLIKGRVQNIEK